MTKSVLRFRTWFAGNIIVAIFTITGISLVAFGSFSCSFGGYSSPSATISVAYSPFETTSLIWIAQDQQYFSKNGLNITLRKYNSGAASFAGLLNNEADVAIGVSEFPVVIRAFQKEKFGIFGNVDTAELNYLVARKDRGITKPSDLRGKKVGTTLGTAAEFYLGRFLELNGMNIRDITLIDLKTPAEWVNSVVAGDVDALVTAQPYASLASTALGSNSLFFSIQRGQSVNSLVISRSDWITSNSALVPRLLGPLLQAADYAGLHPSSAKAIIAKGLDLDIGYMDTVWSQNHFAVTLDQTLVLAMEDEARWMISNKLTSEKVVPNFLDYIYTDGLKTIKPEALHIAGK